MTLLKKLFAVLLTVGTFGFANPAFSQESPDALVKRISQDVINSAKGNKDIQGGNQKQILELVEEKIIPHVNFQRMTQLAAGRHWRDATPEQQKQLIAAFRDLLVYTYSGALTQVGDQEIKFKPLRASPDATEVEVRSEVVQGGSAQPIQLAYRMEKQSDGWKIYDVNVLGAWLVEAYKGTFNSEIGKSGIDGLIKTLQERNKRLANSAGKSGKS